MRKLIMLGLMAATVLPVAAPAAAQSRAEIQRDRENLRAEQGELRHAQRHGDRQDVREERRDVRDARRELREDRADRREYRRDAWQDNRRSNRQLYARGHWRSSNKYRAFRPGVRIGNGYYGPRYVIGDPWRYHLPRARAHQRWVRHYDDVLLVNVRRGVVVDVIRNFFW